MSKRFWFEDSVYVTVSPTDCIPHISTNVLEKELTERLKDKISDPENFNKEERERGGEIQPDPKVIWVDMKCLLWFWATVSII